MDPATQELLRAVGRLEGKIDGVLAEQARIADYTAVTSSRVGALEQKVSGFRGWAAGAGAVAAVAISFLKFLLFGR